MKFYSEASHLWVKVKDGGFIPDPVVPGQFRQVGSEIVQFKGFQYDTDQYHGTMTKEELIEILLKHPSYGYKGTQQAPQFRNKFEPNLFWSENDRPESERMEDRMKRLEAENAALRAATDAKIVYVEKPAKEPEEKLEDNRLDMAFLRAECKRLGIPSERTWKREDYEAALTAKEA